MIDTICPICKQAADPMLLARSSSVDLKVLALVGRQNPGWQAEQGVCPACVQIALDQFKRDGNDLHDIIYRAELAADDPGLLVEPAALPIPLRISSNPHFSGRGVCIAFLDAGFYPHPDLTTPVNRIRAVVDAGKDPVDESATLDDPSLHHAHGMMTTVVAAGNGAASAGRYRGLAPDAELVLIKVAGANGAISEDAIIRGLEWVLANRERYGISIVNISVSGDAESWTWHSPLDRLADRAVAAGLLVVAAAGNSPDAPVLPPASAPLVITVGGVNDYNHPNPDRLDLWHSTFGPTVAGHIKPEILAPSIWLAAPIPPWLPEAAEAARYCAIIALPAAQMIAAAALDITPSDQQIEPLALKGALVAEMARRGWVSAAYKYVDGTSFAAPIVASVAAQMKEANPELDGLSLRGLLIETAEALPGVDLRLQGAGVLQAGAAVGAALRALGGPLAGLPRSPEVVGDTITFVLYAPNAREVAVTGDFNHWLASAGRCEEIRPGVWTYTAHGVAPGRYRYKFLLDEQQWIDDPTNGDKEPDGYGGLSTVLRVQHEALVRENVSVLPLLLQRG